MRISAQKLGFAKPTIYPVTHAVIDEILKNHANKLIVLDASIDPNPQAFFANCERTHMTPITIRMHISPDTAIEHMQKRGRDSDARLIAGLPDRIAMFETVQKQYAATFNVHWPYDYKNVLAKVTEKIGQM